jgi:ubiquinone/menaquinone biosynthesis C-methylase UbiE
VIISIAYPHQISSKDRQNEGGALDKLTGAQKDMYEHFSGVAVLYNNLRTTDLEPIMFIKDMLDGNDNIAAADIGCGAGRYSLQFLQHLGIHHLACIDINELMLEQVSSILGDAGLTNFSTIESTAEHIPLKDNSIDFIFAFNAIHHFDFAAFMQEAARVARDGGSIIIYTRLRSQNGGNIWGRYFPLFLAKENRLYEMDGLKRMIRLVPTLNIQCVKQFRYRRTASLSQLLNLARNSHYSTLSLYQKEEFASALEGFQRNITRHFSDPEHVEWFDDYTMLVVSIS